MAYYFKPSALRDLKRLPKAVQKRLIRKLDYYTGSPDPLKFAKALKDTRYGGYRFRVGDYRIFFDFGSKTRTVIVLVVGHRKEVYK